VKPLEICRSIRACWDALFLPRLVTHLETENAALRAKVGWLEQQSRRLPIVYPENADFSKIPQSVGGTQGFWDADAIARSRKKLFPEEEKPQEKSAS
jgi:hypothetical protein